MKFVDVPGLEDYFQVSKCGKVFSKRSNRELRTVINDKGYRVFSTRLNGRSGRARLLRVHRLVAETYIDNLENKPHVNHKDCNKLNNNVDNLEWCTHRENMNHASANGLHVGKPGITNPNAKLSQAEVDWIRTTYIRGSRKFGGRALSRQSGISRNIIDRVANGTSYRSN